MCDSTNIAALISLGHKNNGLQNYEDTAEFLKIILKFGNILNVKNTTKGHRKRLENATPIYNLQDEKMNWLKSVSNWLKQWKQHHDAHSSSFLTKETYTHNNGYFCSSVY